MAWVGAMNSIRSRIEEIVLKEIIISKLHGDLLLKLSERLPVFITRREKRGENRYYIFNRNK